MREKICKKVLAIIASATMLITGIVAVPVTAAVTKAGTMEIVSIEAEEGETVDVHVVVDVEDGINAVQATVTYDAAELTLTGVAIEEEYADDLIINSNFFMDIENMPVYVPGKLIFIAEADNVDFRPYEIVLTFEVLKAEGDCNLTLSDVMGGQIEATENIVDFTLKNGKVTVTSGTVHEHTYEYVYSVEGTNCITKKVCSDPECADEQLVATVANVAQTKAPVVASSLAIKFRMRQDAVTGYTNVFGKFTKDVYSGNTLTGVSDLETITAVTETVSSIARWTCEYKGIASYEMTSKIHNQIFGTNTSGDVVLLSATDYAFVDYLDSATGTLTPAYNTLFADVANYGAASQTYGGYHTDYLANKNIPAGYASELPTTFVNITNATSGAVAITAAPVFSNNIKMRLRFYKSAVASYNIENLKITVEYIDAYNMPQTFTGTEFTTTGTGVNERWQIDFDALTASSTNDLLTIKLYDGDTEIGALTYGFEAYAKTAYDNYYNATGTTKDLCTLCQAVVAYGRSAKALAS